MRKISNDLETEIVRLALGEEWPVGTVATQVGVHHSVVRRVLCQLGVPRHRVIRRASKLDPYMAFLHEKLDEHPKIRASRLHHMLRKRGYEGCESRVRDVVAQIRPQPKGEAYLRLSTLPGEQAQVDWAHFGKLQIGKAVRPLLAFVMVLSWSRRIFLRFCLDARMPNFVRGHVEAFDMFGGVARVMLYDNLKSAVAERIGNTIRWNPKLLELASHYHFGPRAAAPYRGNEKGRVERAIRYIRDSFFAARNVVDLDELNAEALTWCTTIADARRWPDDRDKTVAEAFVEERTSLLALPEDSFPCEESVDVRVGKRPYVRFDKNDYSVPHTLVRRTLAVLAGPKTVRVCHGLEVVATHERSYDKGLVIEDPVHIQALVERKRAASRHRGLDRLRRAAPSTEVFLARAAERGQNIGSLTKRLLDLLDTYSGAELDTAVVAVNDRSIVHVPAVRQLLEQRRHAQGRTSPLPVRLGDERLREMVVQPHDLRGYDSLGKGHDDDDQD